MGSGRLWQALLLEDAIAAAPAFLQPPLALAHAELPFTHVRGLRERAVAIKAAAVEHAEHLWQVGPPPAAAAAA